MGQCNGLGESLPNAQASLWRQCYQVSTALASPSLSTMLSNKVPHLEVKMERKFPTSKRRVVDQPLPHHTFSMKSTH